AAAGAAATTVRRAPAGRTPTTPTTDARRNGLPASVGGPAAEHGEQQQRDDIGDLDHRVDRRAGGILVGIADGVPGDRRLVRVGALAAVVALLDVFLG